MNQRSVFTTFARQFGLQLLLLIGTLAAAELVLRIVDLRELRDGYHEGSAAVFQYDSELGWLPVPSTVATFTGSRTVTVRSNRFGLRDVEHDRSARPTVMFVGDSFVWGYDVEAGERFTELLRGDFPGVRIVNAGVNAYGTDQEYLLLRRLWDEFKPNFVVLMFCVDNDRQDNTTNSNGGYYKPYVEQTPDGRWVFAGQPAPNSRHAYFVGNRIVKNLWLARAAVTGYIYFRYPKITVPDPTDRLVEMMHDFVTARHAKFLVGLQRHDARLEMFLRAQGIPYASFDGAATNADGNHWTPAGHQLVSDRLRALLTAAGVAALPGSEPIVHPVANN